MFYFFFFFQAKASFTFASNSAKSLLSEDFGDFPTWTPFSGRRGQGRGDRRTPIWSREAVHIGSDTWGGFGPVWLVDITKAGGQRQ